MRRLWILIALLPLACSALLADQVLLRNGDRISGEVLRLEKDTLVLKTRAMGEVRIKWNTVARVSAEKPLHILADGARVEANAIERSDEADLIAGPRTVFSMKPGHIRALSSGDKAPSTDLPELPDPWSGTVDFGLAAARGNSDATNFNVGLRGTRTTDTTRLSLSFNSLLARSRGSDGNRVTSANALRSGARYEVNLSDHIFVFGFGNIESNRVRNLNMRNVLGGGGGVRAAQSKRGTLDVFTGASMNHEAFASASATPDRLAAEMLVGGQSTYSLSNRTSFTGRFSMYPNLTEAGNYRAVLDTSASTRLNSWIGWQMTLSQVYVSNPPLGSRPNDMMLSTGLRFSVGRERPFKPRTVDLKLQ